MAPELTARLISRARSRSRCATRRVGLDGAGATFDDVVRLTFYVTRWTPDRIGEFMVGVQGVAEELGLPTPLPPSSLIGVEVLYEPDVLIEIEATAVLD